ncbi:alpha-galactosidase A-like [Patella vulgata]|uniref:alpha-galactosidase A-like n=1 Tax=Patella vulgata TaxID=6465 RepID=UPI0024A8FD7E|nr:alpha-galactosidase A-like [Patella vulgata]
MADHMTADGYKDVGYEYICIDDCWPSKTRGADGRLVPDPARFPSGMKALADYVHSKGLKLGIYADFGHSTCGGYPGTEFYLETDANTFAEWDLDILKLDICYSSAGDFQYAKFSVIVGLYGLSPDQERAHFGMWSMFAPPLLMAADLRSIRNESKALLQNKNILAINQDPLGRQATLTMKVRVCILSADWISKSILFVL